LDDEQKLDDIRDNRIQTTEIKIHFLLPGLLLLTGIVVNPVEMIAQPGKKNCSKEKHQDHPKWTAPEPSKILLKDF
jgi:hypothetical protein